MSGIRGLDDEQPASSSAVRVEGGRVSEQFDGRCCCCCWG